MPENVTIPTIDRTGSLPDIPNLSTSQNNNETGVETPPSPTTTEDKGGTAS